MKSRKTISKETQDAIKKLLTSKVSLRNESPGTPTIGLDPNFSRILQKKREEQLEASRQKLFDSTVSKSDSMFAGNETGKNSENLGSVSNKKDVALDLENSMMFSKANKSWNDLSGGEDSFLALERQCNMEDKHERLMNADDTLLFDIEPPSEMWNQSINQTIAVTMLSKIQEDEEDENEVDDVDKTIEKCSTEETNCPEITKKSSQFESSSKNSSSTQSSLSETATTVKELSTNCDIIQNNETSSNESQNIQRSKLSQTVPLQTISSLENIDRQRRGTFAFKRANYTFFPASINEEIDKTASISEDASTENLIETTKTKTPTRDILNLETTPRSDNDENDEDQFNNTLERVDYLLEKGKRILEETPVAKRASHHNSLLETPLFSCKRKRLINEMAAEMLPLPKRGPLIDFSTPEVSKKRFFTDKFNEK